MRKGENTNHPKKGAVIRVDPIRKQKDIDLIRRLLADRPADLCYFTVGINTNLRASDILRLTAGQVRDVRAGESFEIREKKTGKLRTVTLNGVCVAAVRNLIARKGLGDGDFLFAGRTGKHWTVPTASQKVKKWCREINLKGNYGSHSLRKTWGFHQHRNFRVPLPVLTQCFSHSSQKQTLDYLCIPSEEIRNVFMNEL